MICSSGIGFDPRLDGTRLTFGFEGIWQGTAVLYDRQTKSLWMHFTGECFAGRLAGRRLEPLESGRHTTWGAWRRDHPETEAMAPDPRFAERYFRPEQSHSGDAFLPPDFPSTIESRDPRLALEALLLGVRADGRPRAYPFAALAKAAGVVEETLGETPVTIWYDVAQRAAAAVDARLDGKPLSFARVTARGVTRFREKGSGSAFTLEGDAETGPLAGRHLRRVPSLLTEWYGWFAHFPATSIWAP